MHARLRNFYNCLLLYKIWEEKIIINGDTNHNFTTIPCGNYLSLVSCK